MMGYVSIHHTVGGKPTIPCTIKAVVGTLGVVWPSGCATNHTVTNQEAGHGTGWGTGQGAGRVMGTKVALQAAPRRNGLIGLGWWGRGGGHSVACLGCPLVGWQPAGLVLPQASLRGGLRPVQGG